MNSINIRPFGVIALCALLLPDFAHASSPPDNGDEDESEALAEAEVEAEVELDSAAPATDRSEQKWIKRWAPERNMAEIGIYGGVLLTNPSHELFAPDPALPDQGFRPLARVAPDLGLRAGYYPSRFFGVEAEGGVMPTSVRDGGGSALLYTVRGQLVGQLGLWSVTPFVLVGAGGIGIASETLGKDIDPALHWGGGVKIYVNHRVMLRLDVRDVVTYKRGVENVFIGHNPEVLLGLSITLGRKKPQPKPQPEQPRPPSDRDGDGIIDELDACPDQAESFNNYQDEDGCPESDRDGDGIWDELDSCPDEAETFNDYQDEDGCPESDRDGDGIWDELDSCPDEPETLNGFQDEDGCPDEVPKAVQEFTGAIKGITFDTGKDTIKKASAPTLDKAVEVLQANPEIRIRISGHTDNQGDHDFNVDLSRRRAESVKTYLVEHGVDPKRIETEGFGPDKPVDSNDTKSGRANNRRIEFEIIRRAR